MPKIIRHSFEFWIFNFLQIMDELNKNAVEIYRFPTDDETVADMNNQMNVSTYYCFSKLQ